MEQREAKRSKMPKTDIVCKFFLDAVKNKVYGYKWHCPNGDDCHYRHCLPKDYVIQTLQGKIQEEMTIEEFQDLEEKIDQERERLAVNGTKVTEKVFLEWKEKREKSKHTIVNKKADLIKKLKTGKELFMTGLEIQDDENADDEVYVNQCNQLEEETKNIQSELWGNKEENTDQVKVDTELFKDEGNLDDVELEDEDNAEVEDA